MCRQIVDCNDGWVVCYENVRRMSRNQGLYMKTLFLPSSLKIKTSVPFLFRSLDFLSMFTSSNAGDKNIDDHVYYYYTLSMHLLVNRLNIICSPWRGRNSSYFPRSIIFYEKKKKCINLSWKVPKFCNIEKSM